MRATTGRVDRHRAGRLCWKTRYMCWKTTLFKWWRAAIETRHRRAPTLSITPYARRAVGAPPASPCCSAPLMVCVCGLHCAAAFKLAVAVFEAYTRAGTSPASSTDTRVAIARRVSQAPVDYRCARGPCGADACDSQDAPGCTPHWPVAAGATYTRTSCAGAAAVDVDAGPQPGSPGCRPESGSFG